MEIVWKEFSPVRLVFCSVSTVEVDGILPPPEDREPATVLSCTAKTTVDSAAIENDIVIIEGSLTARITALDTDGRLFVFDSTASFEHSIEAAGAAAGMTSDIKPTVKKISVSPGDDGLRLSAMIELDAAVTAKTPLRVIDGMSGVDDLEMRYLKTTCVESTNAGSRTLRMREEITESGVSEVLSCSARAIVRDIILENGGYSVSGILFVSALASDRDSRPISIFRQLAFREHIDLSPIGRDVYCRAEVKDVRLHSLGEEFSLLALEAEINFSVYGMDSCEIDLPADAFSPTIGFDCLKDNVTVRSSLGEVAQTAQIKEESTVPDDMADVANALFAEAQPIVTSALNENGRLTVSGILMTTVVYQSTGGNIYSYSDDVPFSTELLCEGGSDLSRIECGCCAQTVALSDRTVQLNYSLQFEIENIELKTFEVVVGLAEKEAERKPSGILIAFASDGDTEFDIAKRYSVSSSRVSRLESESGDILKEGERLLIIR